MNPDRKKEIDDALASFFFGCNIPFVTVESEYFINLIHCLNPEYSPPIRKTLAGPTLNEKYNQFRNSVRQETTQDGVLLVDGWKNSVANTKNVVAIVRTTSGQNVFLESWDCSSIRETGEVLSIVVNECVNIALQQFNINIYMVLTDNASNMLNMGGRVNLWFATCNSHSENLLFKSLTNPELDEKVTDIIKDFRFPNLESKLIRGGGKKMILYAETRWCSRRNSYRRCLENLNIMRAIVQENELEDEEDQFKFKNGVIETILNDEFEMSLINALLTYNPVCSLVNVCQKSNCSIAHATEKWLKLELPNENVNFERALEERLSKAINKYGLAANFLHPVYRGQRFANNARYVAMKDQFFTENLNHESLVQLQEYINQSGVFQRLFNREFQSWELFWRATRHFYPELAVVAVKLLHIPASTGDLERLFSQWSLVHTKLRSRLREHRSVKLITLYYASRLKFIKLMVDGDMSDDNKEE